MKKFILGWLLAGALALASSTALATFHTFIIQEIYSNASGTVQYVVLQEAQGFDGQNFFKTHGITRTISGSQFLSIPFPQDLPSQSTARKFVLIGTQSFAALGLITPDYVVPDGFLGLNNGLVNFAGVDQIDYAALPTDGVNALYRDGSVRPNLATNFNGNTASVATTAVAANYQGLWFNPMESGWGINFAHQGDVIFASWFTYDLSGKGTWLVMTASKTAPGIYTGQLFQGTGPAYDAVPFPPLGSPGGATVSGLGGTGTITFTDANNATFAYTVAGISQSKSITRQLFGPQPICTFGAQANLALATNYTDLWWATPPGSEAGWGINLTHQGDIIFASWFTFDHDRTPMWLVVQANKTVPGTYVGTQLYRLTGPAFNATPFPPIGSTGGPTGTIVGTASFSFSDGNSAMFSYTINGLTQTKAITREVFTSPGTVCSAPAAGLTNAEGLWSGTTSDNRMVRAIILDDGTYYIAYSYSNLASYAGAVQGSSTATSGTLISSDGFDFPIARASETNDLLTPTAVTGTYVTGSSLNLAIVGAAGDRSFAGSYDAAYLQPANLAAAAGTYTGLTGHAGGALSATFTLDASGHLVGHNAGCTFTGTITPRGSTNVFDFVANGVDCIFSPGSPVGILHYDEANRQVHGFTPFHSRTDQWYLIGQK